MEELYCIPELHDFRRVLENLVLIYIYLRCHDYHFCWFILLFITLVPPVYDGSLCRRYIVMNIPCGCVLV